MKAEEIIKELELNYGYKFEKNDAANKWQYDWLCEMMTDVQSVVKNNDTLPIVISCLPHDEKLQDEKDLLNIRVSNYLMLNTKIPVEQLVDICIEVDKIYKPYLR